jgi:sugar phosphate isomerase/epimerase
MARLLSIAAGVHPDLTPDRMVAVAAEAGWPACGIWFDPDSWTDATTRAVRRRLDDTGIIGLDLEPIIPAPDHDDHGERIIDVAAELGVGNVLFTSRLPDLSTTIDRFANLCERASEVGVRLVCEFLPIFPLRSLSMALDVVAPHSPTVAGLLVDNLHLSRSGSHPEDLRHVDARRLPYLQIADAPDVVPTEFMALLDEALNGRLLPGEGALPITELLSTVPDVPLSFEVRSRHLREHFSDPVERARYLLDRCVTVIDASS